jgi:Tfp pilus assembly protein PilF
MNNRLYGIGILLIFTFIVSGCAVSSKDMRLSNEAYENILDDNYKDAEPKLLEALEKNPDNHYAQLNLGVVYHNTGRLDKAKEMYVKVIDSDTDDVAERSNDKKQRGRKLVDIAKDNLALLEKSKK